MRRSPTLGKVAEKMRIAIGIVLLLLSTGWNLPAQAPSPASGKAADKAAPAGKNVESQTAPKKNIATLPPPTVDQRATDKNENATDNKRTDDAQQPVRVIEFPPVSVTKDWADRAIWIFSGLLVIVGGLQVWLLAATLSAMRRQGLSMRRQTTHIRRSASAARKSANAAAATVKIMQETAEKQLRAYVYVVAASRQSDGIREPTLRVQIKNAGQTPAYDCVRYAVEAVSPTFPQLPENFETFPVKLEKYKSPIPPGESVEIVTTAVQPDPRQIGEISRSKAAIYLFGKIEYRDAFGNSRESTFRLVCVGENVTRGLFAVCDEGNTAT
jgi:hypothetical protein